MNQTVINALQAADSTLRALTVADPAEVGRIVENLKGPATILDQTGRALKTATRGVTTTDPENYRVIIRDRKTDGESARTVAVLTYINKPEMTEETEYDESVAMGIAIVNAGGEVHAETPQSAYSPTGRWFWRAPFIDVYERFIVVTQSGGMDV